LVSQERGKGRKLAHFELKPNATEFLQYKGHWCIGILKGPASQLQVTGFGVGSVKGKEGDRLLMK